MSALLLLWERLPAGVRRFICEIALITILITGAYFWGIHAERARVAATAAAQTAKAQAKATTAEIAHANENTALVVYRDSHPVEPVRLCNNVRAPDRTQQVDAGSGTARADFQSVHAGDSGIRPGAEPRDIGPMLEALAARADKVSAELREYQGRGP